MAHLALLDASSNAVDVVDTPDVKGYIAKGYRDATGAGYLWHWTGSVWQDTAAAQAWRTQATSDAAAESPKIANRTRAAAIFAAIRAFLIFLCFSCLIGCPPRDAEKQIPRVIAPLQQPVHDLDRQLAVGTRWSIAGIALCTAASIILALEVHMFVHTALAGLAGSLGSFLMLSALRLALPILAMVMPWATVAAILLGLCALLLWWRRRRLAPKP